MSEFQKKITKIRTGGQSGVDRAAMDFARENGIPLCGWCPKYGWAEDYPDPPGLLADYPELVETPSEGTEQRTKWNMRDCDAILTIIPNGSKYSKGTEVGLAEGTSLGKPMFTAAGADDVPEIVRWIGSLPDGIELCVGGPRASECPDGYAVAKEVLGGVWSVLTDGHSMNKSIYESIKEAIVDGQLPDDFSLPDLTDGEEVVSFEDGALDGITMYHMPPFEMTEENYQMMAEAINFASNHEFEIADSLFIQLSKENRAISISDKLQQYIIDNQDNLKAGNLYEYAVGLIKLSDNRECVKYGLLILGLLVINNEEVKDVVRVLALSDEFTLFCIHIMYKWSGGNNDIFETAKRVHGWGRIHALELLRPLMPRAEEIREWMLKEGINNNIAPFYSALTCWRNANIGSILYVNPTYEDLHYIGKILDAMLDESAVPGISTLDKRIDILLTYLKKAQKHALCADDYQVIYHICQYGEAVNAAEVSQVAKDMLHSDRG